MASSTFTPNLGIEQPATGAYANTWGLVANRSYAVIDAAIGGSAQVPIGPTLPGAPYLLSTTQGSDPSNATNPLIIWTGAQTAQGLVAIGPNTQQRIYIMSNQTTATDSVTGLPITPFPIAFSVQQGTGAPFVLQGGYDALVYSNGAGSTGAVAPAINNPQFNNVLIQGNLQINGSLTGNLNFGDVNVHTLGVGSPASMPDPLVINAPATALAAQLRLVLAGGSQGVILSNDGGNFYVMTTAPGNPYGPYLPPPTVPLWADLTTGAVGVAGSQPQLPYGLNAPSILSGSLITANGPVQADAVDINDGTLVDFKCGAGNSGEGMGSGRTTTSRNRWGLSLFAGGLPRVDVANNGQVGINHYPPDGHALCVGGLIHTTAGIVFPDGSVQTSAVSGTFPQLSVSGNASIGGIIYGPGVGGGPRLAVQLTNTQGGPPPPSLTTNGSLVFVQADPWHDLQIYWRDNAGAVWVSNIGNWTQVA